MAAAAQAKAAYEDELIATGLKPALKKNTRAEGFLSLLRDLYLQSREGADPQLRESLIAKLCGPSTAAISPSSFGDSTPSFYHSTTRRASFALPDHPPRTKSTPDLGALKPHQRLRTLSFSAVRVDTATTPLSPFDAHTFTAGNLTPPRRSLPSMESNLSSGSDKRIRFNESVERREIVDADEVVLALQREPRARFFVESGSNDSDLDFPHQPAGHGAFSSMYREASQPLAAPTARSQGRSAQVVMDDYMSSNEADDADFARAKGVIAQFVCNHSSAGIEDVKKHIIDMFGYRSDFHPSLRGSDKVVAKIFSRLGLPPPPIHNRNPVWRSPPSGGRRHSTGQRHSQSSPTLRREQQTRPSPRRYGSTSDIGRSPPISTALRSLSPAPLKSPSTELIARSSSFSNRRSAIPPRLNTNVGLVYDGAPTPPVQMIRDNVARSRCKPPPHRRRVRAPQTTTDPKAHSPSVCVYQDPSLKYPPPLREKKKIGLLTFAGRLGVAALILSAELITRYAKHGSFEVPPDPSSTPTDSYVDEEDDTDDESDWDELDGPVGRMVQRGVSDFAKAFKLDEAWRTYVEHRPPRSQRTREVQSNSRPTTANGYDFFYCRDAGDEYGTWDNYAEGQDERPAYGHDAEDENDNWDDCAEGQDERAAYGRNSAHILEHVASIPLPPSPTDCNSTHCDSTRALDIPAQDDEMTSAESSPHDEVAAPNSQESKWTPPLREDVEMPSETTLSISNHIVLLDSEPIPNTRPAVECSVKSEHEIPPDPAALEPTMSEETMCIVDSVDWSQSYSPLSPTFPRLPESDASALADGIPEIPYSLGPILESVTEIADTVVGAVDRVVGVQRVAPLIEGVVTGIGGVVALPRRVTRAGGRMAGGVLRFVGGMAGRVISAI
ncbi:hypothetical protein BJ742DRAFT_81333 [Cladochytrium replicatum]|nr:hypothetical protein BJ742DRAFT_81333 [Cladochytrium replicatum]